MLGQLRGPKDDALFLRVEPFLQALGVVTADGERVQTAAERREELMVMGRARLKTNNTQGRCGSISVAQLSFHVVVVVRSLAVFDLSGPLDKSSITYEYVQYARLTTLNPEPTHDSPISPCKLDHGSRIKSQ